MVEQDVEVNPYDVIFFANLLTTARKNAENLVRATREAKKSALTTEYAEWKAFSKAIDIFSRVWDASNSLHNVKDLIDETMDSPATSFFLELTETKKLIEALSGSNEIELIKSIRDYAWKLNGGMVYRGPHPPLLTNEQARGIAFCVDEKGVEVNTLAEVARKVMKGVEELRSAISRSKAFRAVVEVADGLSDKELENKLLDAGEVTKAFFDNEWLVERLRGVINSALSFSRRTVEELDSLSRMEPTRLDVEPGKLTKAAELAVKLKDKLIQLSEMAPSVLGIDIAHDSLNLPDVDYSLVPVGAGKVNRCYGITVDDTGSATGALEKLGDKGLELVEKLSKEFEGRYSYVGACVVDNSMDASTDLLEFCEGAGTVSIDADNDFMGYDRRFIGNVVGDYLYMFLPKASRGSSEVKWLSSISCRARVKEGGKLMIECDEPYTDEVRYTLRNRCIGDKYYVECKNLNADDLRKIGTIIAKTASAEVRMGS
ncbi:MAG: hypothetical protein ACP5IE_00345 [Infirmifilum sp.]